VRCPLPYLAHNQQRCLQLNLQYSVYRCTYAEGSLAYLFQLISINGQLHCSVKL
jgi:hypothetical protein